MQRNNSLDALRGLAILAMVLSSSIAFGILPAWMYHAQTPPPGHVFNPDRPGITWVDLVFPFFLFSMGAAIPLALNKKLKESAGFWSIAWIAARRYLLLVFFALFTVHARSAMISSHPYPVHYLLSMAAFVLLFFQFYKPAGVKHQQLFAVVQALAFVLAGLMLYLLPFKEGKGFSLNRSDIIIIVLGNMAFFGTLVWWFTRHRPWWRIGLLPILMALILGAKIPGSWNETVFRWSPLPWMYQFYYLKYLFLVIPGTLAGEWLLQQKASDATAKEQAVNSHQHTIAFLSMAVIIINVILLLGRHTNINLILTAMLCALIYVYLRKAIQEPDHLLVLFYKAGTYLLLLGLFFEAYEGGIKKDPSTFSYYLVTGGLAFFMLLFFYGFQDTRIGSRIVHYLSLNGRNPMVAYVTGNLLLLPLLHLTGGMALYTAMQQKVATGILSGVLFTTLVSLVTVWFTKKGWYWKT